MREKTVKNSVEKKLISVVIPAYKAEDFIIQSLRQVKSVLDQMRHPYEIICVVDGKTDRTYEKAKTLSMKYPGKVRVVGYLTNLGKGHAVRYGMARARGNIIGFVDKAREILVGLGFQEVASQIDKTARGAKGGRK